MFDTAVVALWLIYRVSYRSVLAVVKVRSKTTTTTAVWVKCLLVVDASDDLARFAVTRRSACSEIAHALHSVLYIHLYFLIETAKANQRIRQEWQKQQRKK